MAARRGCGVEDFANELNGLDLGPGTIGLAVSGGADSLALLLLASEVVPFQLVAATVDHGLRAESASEAQFVAGVCADLGVAHVTLAATVVERGAGLQAAARDARYAALGAWAEREGLAAVATGHHADDQAETLLMRLARGAGLAGLSGIRPDTVMPGSDMAPAAIDHPGVRLVRPLIGWRRAELAQIVAEAGLTPVEDPSNSNPRYDRTAARALLRETPWLDAARLAASAAHLSEAEVALDWAAEQAWGRRAVVDEAGVAIEPDGLPAELRRRLVLRALAAVGGAPSPPGPKLAVFIASLASGGVATLSGVRGEGGRIWRFRRAPPRRGN